MNQIDLIIDALSVLQNSVWSTLNEQALAAARELQAELAKQEFYPDWDMLQPFHERIAELEAELAKPEQGEKIGRAHV